MGPTVPNDRSSCATTWEEGSRETWSAWTAVGPLVVSQRLVDALRAHGSRGWSGLPVELYDRAGQMVPGYYALVITGRCGRISRWRSLSPRGFLKTGAIGYGLQVNRSSWDGSDLSVPKESAFTLVTEPVIRALTRAHLTNLEFQPISEVEVPLI